MIKVLGESRDMRNIPRHNKGNIQQANSQHQTKYRETENDPIDQEQDKVSTLTISVQNSA